MRTKTILPVVLAVVVCLLGLGPAHGLGLADTFYNMGAATEAQTRADASNNLRRQYPSAPPSVPSYATFEGYFVPASNNTQVAVFSDDGVDFYVNGSLVLNRKDVGQHLPTLSQSFQVVSYSWTAGQCYLIKIEYSNIIYTGQYDIDGCTMYAYLGGGAIYDWTVNIDTDSDNSGSIVHSVDDPIEETSARYVAPNTDDDNGNSTPDKDESDTVAGEDDLAEADVQYTPTTGIDGAKITFVASSGSDKIKVWKSSTKGTGNEITVTGSGTTYVIGTDTIPSTVWVEGIATGDATLDVVMKRSDNTEICRDKVLFTVRDTTPPTFTQICVSPAAAKCGDEITITFTASEELASSPTVTVNGYTAQYVSNDGNNYTYSYTLTSWETVGEATIHIYGYDLDYNYGEINDTQALYIVPCQTGGCELGSFTYDKRGNRKTMCDSRGTTVYSYDALNRLTKVLEPDGKWIEYEYDLNNNRTKMTVVLAGGCGQATTQHVTQYAYSDRSGLSTVTDQLAGNTTYTYKNNGVVDTITYPNGTKAVHSYNSRNWLTCVSNRKSDDTIVGEFTYSYDPTYWGKHGTRTRVVENILKPDGNRISAQVDYEYDDLYRLVHEHRIAHGGGDPGVAYEYNFAYDDAGNRTSWETVGGSTISYTYDAANRMTSPGTFTYDDRGNTLTHTVGGITTTYTWDVRNLMTRWQKTNETTIDFVYDGVGLRVGQVPSGGTATDFLLDGKDVVEEIAGANVTSHVGSAEYLISKIAGTTRTVYHADGAGSTRAMSDESQAVTQAGIYDAYGDMKQDYPASSAPGFGYAGQYRYYADSTGLDYLKARYYDPEVGRFTARDPIKSEANLYAYAQDDPANRVDPLGLMSSLIGCYKVPWACAGLGIGTAGTVIGTATPAVAPVVIAKPVIIFVCVCAVAIDIALVHECWERANDEAIACWRRCYTKHGKSAKYWLCGAACQAQYMADTIRCQTDPDFNK